MSCRELLYSAQKMFQELIDNAKPDFQIILDKDEDDLTVDDKNNLKTFQDLYTERFINETIEKYANNNANKSKNKLTVEIYIQLDSMAQDK